MLLTLFNIVYVLVAMAMIILILLQRGSGAQAGSGFGGGASGTVFGARGAATFLSRSTGFLAAAFFLLSLGMAWYLGHERTARPADDLGVMSGLEAPAAPKAPAATSGGANPGNVAPNSDVPTAPASSVPASPATTDVPTASTVVPPAPAVVTAPATASTPATQAPATKPADKKKH